jgi:2-iminobutanoate/2-iminopropanoate deaminase
MREGKAQNVPKTTLQPAALARPYGAWSPAVLAEPGRLLFIAGQTARDASGEVVGEGDVSRQTEQVCANLEAAVRAVGGMLSDIVSMTVYATDVTDHEAIHEVRRRYFPVDPPAATMVEVSRLVDPRCLIEANAIAVIASREQEF